MKLALLGVGNAGVRLVDQLHGAEGPENPLSNGNLLVINTTPSTFAETDHIADDRQVLIGDTHPEVSQPETPRAGEKREEGDAAETTDQPEGVAGDPELGVEVAREDLPEIRRALDSVDDTEVDAAMVVAGLGGGTGCGVGSVLLEELTSIYEIPVYVLGVLPSDDESDQRAWNAARAIQTVVPKADAVLPIDNETWHEGGDEYTAVNDAVTERLLSLFGAGEAEGKPLPELRMDPNDIKRTLAVGGVSTVGYVRTELPVEPVGWFEKLRRLLGWGTAKQPVRSDATTIKKLVEEALESTFTLPCDISTTDRVLLILTGPPRELSRKGFETGRSLLETETGTVEILAGDNPDPEATAVTATLLLANVTGVDRIETLQERAVEFKRRQRAQPTEPAAETVKPTETGEEDDTETDSADPIDAEQTRTETSPEITEAEPDVADGDGNDHGFKFENKPTRDPEDGTQAGTETAGSGVSETETSDDVESLVVEAEPAADTDRESGEDTDSEPAAGTEEPTTESDADDDRDVAEAEEDAAEEPTAEAGDSVDQDTATESDTETAAEPETAADSEPVATVDEDATSETDEQADESGTDDTEVGRDESADDDTTTEPVDDAEDTADVGEESVESTKDTDDGVEVERDDSDEDAVAKPEDEANSEAESDGDTDDDTGSDEDGTNDTAGESDENADDESDDADETTDGADETTDDADASAADESDDSEPTIKDPFAGPSTMDEPNQ